MFSKILQLQKTFSELKWDSEDHTLLQQLAIVFYRRVPKKINGKVIEKTRGFDYISLKIKYLNSNEFQFIEWSLQGHDAMSRINPHGKKIISFEEALEHLTKEETEQILFNLDLFT